MKRGMGSRRRRVAGCLLGLVTLAAIAGCGSSSGASSGGASGGSVNVGVLVPLSGELGPFGKPWVQAAQLAIDDANGLGSLPKGAKLHAVVADERTDAATGLDAAKKMISTQNVPLIIGPTSDPMLALVPLVKRARVPVISSSAGSVGLNRVGGDFAYRTVASDDADGLAIAKFLESKGAKQVSLFVDNTASSISVGSTLRKGLEGLGGSVGTQVIVNPGQSSYRAEVGKVLAGKPSWVVCACGQQTGTSILKEMESSGYTGQRLVTADLTTPDAVKAVGASAMNGVYGELPSPDESLPAYKTFASSFKKRFGAAAAPFTANTYDAAAIGVLSMIAAKSTNGADINAKIRDVANPPGKMVTSLAAGAKALKAGQDINYEGASGPVDFDASGTTSSSYAILQVKAGAFKQVVFYPASDFVKAGG